MTEVPTTFSRYYQQWRDGDLDAQERIIKLVYSELCRIAQSYLRKEYYAASIEPAMLADDVALQLLGAPVINWQNRKHFFLTAADRMQKLLVNHARQRVAQKRIPQAAMFPLHEMEDILGEETPDLIALNDALEAFAQIDLRAYYVVKLRFFFGLTQKEIALALDISLGAVKYDWQMAQLWLFNQLH